MIKIAFVTDTIYSPSAGTEKQILLLLKHLDRSAFSPVLCVAHSSEWLNKHFNICPIFDINIRTFKSPIALGKFRRFVSYLKKEKINIVHTLARDGMRIGIIAGKFAGVKSIISVRRNQGYSLTKMDLVITKLLNRWVNIVIANSHNTRRWAEKIENLTPAKIKVIHNGIDLEPFASIGPRTRLHYRAELEIPADAPVVGIVANLRLVKQLDIFLKTAHIIKTELPNTCFVIVGEGDQQSNLRQLACNLNIANSVRFLGRRFDIPSILSVFDVAVLTSYSESFSNSVVEYLAAGLPIVCTDVGGLREAVDEGINGYLVPVGDYALMADRIISILRSGISCSMGLSSLSKANRHFSLGPMIAAYENIYRACQQAAHVK